MILLSIQLSLKPQTRESALAGTPFLGGVLHGVLENLIRSHAPEIAADIGIGADNQVKRYAVVPPPFGWQAQLDENPVHLPCGVMLFGHAQKHAERVAGLLFLAQEIRLAGKVDRIQEVSITVCAPGCAARPASPDRPFPELVQPDFNSDNFDFGECRCITLEWLTPLTLESAGQRAKEVNHQPPGLLRLVRSLSKRMHSLEPQLLAGIVSADWIAAEEAVRRLEADSSTLRAVRWQYGSRTKSQPIQLGGLVGSVEYRGQIPGPIHSLLQWGSWFGVGQRTALGQGMYVVHQQ